jgi:hypothetical protein
MDVPRDPILGHDRQVENHWFKTTCFVTSFVCYSGEKSFDLGSVDEHWKGGGVHMDLVKI